MSLDCSRSPGEDQQANQHALPGYQLVPRVCSLIAPFFILLPTLEQLKAVGHMKRLQE